MTTKSTDKTFRKGQSFKRMNVGIKPLDYASNLSSHVIWNIYSCFEKLGNSGKNNL